MMGERRGQLLLSSQFPHLGSSFLLQEESDGEIMTLEDGECDSPCWCDDTRSPGST